jgi:hypothetical protein
MKIYQVSYINPVSLQAEYMKIKAKDQWAAVEKAQTKLITTHRETDHPLKIELKEKA